LVWIAAGIAEFESGSVEDLWEPPATFRDPSQLHTWVVYGKKGAGKSTLVEYLEAKVTGDIVLVVKPADDPAFYKAFAEIISRFHDAEPHLLTLIAQSFVDVVVTTALMADWHGRHRGKFAAGDEASVYEFLTTNGIIGGSPLRRIIHFLEAATTHSSAATDFSQFLHSEGNVPFERAREAFLRLLASRRVQDRGYLVCIDDIDDINFEYTHADRVLVDALLGFTHNANSLYRRNKVPIKVLLTCPSELYEHRRLWGHDKIKARAFHLRWSDAESIRALINKRIAVRLGIRRRKPRDEDDRFSIESNSTWARVFPETITNRKRLQENAFEYCLRHTFYTPRELLLLIDSIYEDEGRPSLDLNSAHVAGRWSELFQRKVSDTAVSSAEAFYSIFDKVYDGLSEMLDSFRSRPNVWMRTNLEHFLAGQNLSLTGRETGHAHRAEALVAAMYRMGFLGLGFRDSRREATKHLRYFDVRYSFLTDRKPDPRWQIAVVPPVFYDFLEIHSNLGIVVRPHDRLVLPDVTVQRLSTYNHRTNSFLDD
jgi:hypothetical protein